MNQVAEAIPATLSQSPRFREREVVPLKYVFAILNGSTPKSSEPSFWDGDIGWATPDDLGNFEGNTLSRTRRKITQEGYGSCGTSMAPRGSLVLSTRAPIGHLAIAGIPLCTNQGCRCLVFREEEDCHYFYFQLLSLRDELESWGQGSTFKELSRDKLGAIRLLRPSLPEQRAIAGFLDRETGRIDALIEKKCRQIELLHEKRAALISHAVTKGLDPTVPMKDSGIEWMGGVPAHWTITRFGWISRVARGASPRPAGDTRFFHGDHIPWITVAEITKDSSKFLTNTETMLTEEGRARSRLLKHGTLVLTNSGATLGAPKILSIDGCANDGVVAFESLDASHSKDYLYYYLLSLTDMYRERIRQGSGQPNLNTYIVRATQVPSPPLNEQEAITSYIEAESDRADALVARIEQSILRLREYRTALISAAVTGKIDVRGEVLA